MKKCPFCGAPGEIKQYRYEGTGASGMETPTPYARCSEGCCEMTPVDCDDWPYGQARGALSNKQAHVVAEERWNTRK